MVPAWTRPVSGSAPGIALLKVEAETAEYWDASSSMVKIAVGAVKATVKKDPDQFPADNRTVEL